ncbi:MAG: hypothetical protein ATN36_03970 [Epulopiscium sp. Nele67-Bin005]|nr:MAG: hypothetical protein ATN36_03970 [Epulopiscium sp. Nele67-Bin005]
MDKDLILTATLALLMTQTNYPVSNQKKEVNLEEAMRSPVHHPMFPPPHHYPHHNHQPQQKDCPNKNTVFLQEGFNEVYSHQVLKIALPDNPYSGNTWESYFPPGVDVVKETFKPAKKNQEGTRKWTLSIDKPGRYTLVVDYVKKSRPNEVLRRRRYIIDVLPVPPYCK